MSRVVHFEIGIDQPERALRFYSEVFGWKIEKYPGSFDYWLVYTGQDQPGIDGALAMRGDLNAATVNTIDVPSLEEYSQRVVQMGGQVISPKMPIPGVGYFAYCLDTEGNRIGILQADPNAH